MKILSKYTFLLALLVSSHFLVAQGTNLNKQVAKIEHLAEYNQYDEAEKKADKLLLLFNTKYKSNKYLEYKLRLLLLKGRMYEIKEENNKALELLLKVADEAKSNNYHKISCHTNIMLALIYEKQETPKLAKHYLDIADKIRKEHHLEELYSTLLVRRSLYHRWFTKDIDSAMYYTKKALGYAKKYDNEYDIAEAFLMIGIYENERKNYLEAVKYFPFAAQYYLKTNNYNEASLMYYNMAYIYEEINSLNEAIRYNDTAYTISQKASTVYQRHISQQRSELFQAINNIDSAYFYLKKSLDLREIEIKEDEAVTIKNITEKYDNEQKEATIKSKNRQMILIISLLGVIVVASVLLFVQNRKIRARNKIINKQLAELSKTLDQKQVLLLELQHRVKNNLQHVISILEIQKESIDFNNIDELIRGNQNRIHSMALLHKKLNVNEHVNEVELERYITELSELVKDSYDNHKKKISLSILACEIENIAIEKALPLGLIITELVSNSMKHAFKKRSIGIINIGIRRTATRNQLYYADNGSGFDFHTNAQSGLGLEIIKGLIDQLDGTVETTNNNNGFELLIYF
mgnify:CR=1 FL=1